MTSRSWLDPRISQRFGPFVSAERLAPDASVRAFTRVRLPGGGHAILLTDEEGGPAAIERLVEAQRLLEGIGVPVPGLLDADPALSAVLLEDLGDLLLAEAPGRLPRARVLAAHRHAARVAARIGVRGTPLVDEAHPLAERPLGRRRLREELAFFVRHEVEGRRGCADPALIGALDSALDALADRLGRLEPVFAHRDFHARNLLVRPDDRVGVVDFQDALPAPPLYDLASLLHDPYVDADPERVRQAAAAFGEEAGLASDVLDDPRLPAVALQRLLKALGTYGYQVGVRRNLRYLSAIARAERSALAAARAMDDEPGPLLAGLMGRLGFGGGTGPSGAGPHESS